MALSMEKLKEMEAEMNRFEQEIAFPNVMPQASRPVIGAHTYNRIAEQLHKQQQQMEHQAYSMSAMIGMYAEGISVHPQEQAGSQTALQFIPHQLQIHQPQQEQIAMQNSQMDMGDAIMNMQPQNPVEEIISSGGPFPSSTSATPAVYSAPPVKVRKIEQPIVTIPPPKVETYIPQPIEQPLIVIPPPLPVKKAPTVIPYEDSYSLSKKKERERRRRCIRTAGGQSWEDTSLLEWELDDFRIFCGDLGNDVTDEVLTRAFSKYPSFLKAKVVRDKRNNKTKGYGFVSFKDPQDFIKAMREMNGMFLFIENNH
uniref:RNA-binding protein 42 n=1 Tax=Strigamia maritima TaxID=126957 RepID=T1J005_STRMM